MGKVCRDGNILPVGPSPKSVVYNRNRVSIVAKSLLFVLAFVFAYAGAWAQEVKTIPETKRAAVAMEKRIATQPVDAVSYKSLRTIESSEDLQEPSDDDTLNDDIEIVTDETPVRAGARANGNITWNFDSNVTNGRMDCGSSFTMSGSYSGKSLRDYYYVLTSTSDCPITISCTELSGTGNSSPHVYIYEGSGTDGTRLADWATSGGSATSSSGVVTVRIKRNSTQSNRQVSYILTINQTCCVSCDQTINMGNITQTIDCGTTYCFYDDGGPSNDYNSIDGHYTATFTSLGTIKINFSQFTTESSSSCSDWDYIEIYNGNETTGTLLVRGQTGCSTRALQTDHDYVADSKIMTVVWYADGSISAAGWAATITAENCCSDPNFNISGCPAGGNLALGSTQQLSYSRLGGGAVTWTSDNTSVATVTAGGLVEAVGMGSATITATLAASGSYCARTATCDIDVTCSEPTVVVPGPFNYSQGASVSPFTPAITYNGGSLPAGTTYLSSNTSVADVSDMGLLTPYTSAGGNATITVTIPATGGYCPKTVTYTVSVSCTNPGLELTGCMASNMNIGDTRQLSATYTGGGTITWSSDDTNIATVSNSGFVTAVAEGTTTIRARLTSSGAYCSDEATCSVTIGCLQIGSGTSLTHQAPLYDSRNYSYSQMIYTAAEIGGTGTINSIAFNASSAQNISRTVQIYIGMTDKTAFADGNDFISVSGLTAVYSGNWSVAAGWNTFSITPGFEYDDPSKNVFVAVYSTAASNSYSQIFYNTNTGANQTIVAYDNSNNPNPVLNDGSWLSYGGSKSVYTFRPNVKFCIQRCTPRTGTFAFASEYAGATIGTAFTAPRLNNFTGATPEFSSSNTSVATVNPTTGEVTLVAVGEAVITATLDVEGGVYCPKATSYTLTVSNTDIIMGEGIRRTIECGTIYNFYDDGGADGNYAVDEFFTGPRAAVFTSRGDITINFSQFVTELNADNPCGRYDFMKIYDGDIATGTMLAWGQTGCDAHRIDLNHDYVATSGTMTIEWQSDDSDVAAGWAATITADDCCTPHPEAFAFEEDYMYALTGVAFMPPVLRNDIGAGTITYSSDNTDVALVDNSGNVVLVGNEGLVTITATYGASGEYCASEAFYTINVSNSCEVIVNGATTSADVPLRGASYMSYAQMIYTAAEIRGSDPTGTGIIRSIAFDSREVNSVSRNVKIYMAMTDKTAFDNATDFVPVSQMTLVYAGGQRITEGWNVFNIDDFMYTDGSKNIVVALHSKASAGAATSFSAQNGSTYKTVYAYTASSNPSNNPNPVTVEGGIGWSSYGENSDNSTARSTYRPNAKFCIDKAAVCEISYNTTANCAGATSIPSTYGLVNIPVAISSEVPECSSGTFIGWKDGADNEYDAGDFITPTGSTMTLYAQYRDCSGFSVTVSKPDGGQSAEDGTVINGVLTFDVCYGSVLRIKAEPDEYHTLSSCRWEVNPHNGIINSYSGASLNYPVSYAMGHDITLHAVATNGCPANIPIRVRISKGLIITGDDPSAGRICVGNSHEIVVGDHNVPNVVIDIENEAIDIKASKGESEVTFLPDGCFNAQGESCYESGATFADFPDDARIESADNIDYVRINLEHSFIGDLQVSVVCPNGQSAILLEDKYNTSDDGIDDYEYEWPYTTLWCYALYKRYYKVGDCGMGEDSNPGYVYYKQTYVVYNGSYYAGTGVRAEATAFEITDDLWSSYYNPVRGMVNAAGTHPPADFCDDDYYYVFDGYELAANNYTSSNYGDDWGSYVSYLSFGEPSRVDNNSDNCDANQAHGIGWDYCWSNNESSGYGYAGGTNGYVRETANHQIGITTEMAVTPSDVTAHTQFYHPLEDFSGLEGCPLNGEWKIKVCDSWDGDNGFIFEWEIVLRNVVDEAWSYNVELESTSLGDCPGSGNDTLSLVYPGSLVEPSLHTNFFIHPTLQNVASNNITIPTYPDGADRNCELIIHDNLGCKSPGREFSYTITQPTKPGMDPTTICLGETTTIDASLSTIGTGTISGTPHYYWWLNDERISHPVTGATAHLLSDVTPASSSDVYGVEVYDGNGCGGMVDTVIKINVPDDIDDLSDYTYIWRGAASTDWNVNTNWYTYNDYEEEFRVASVLPSLTDSVYIGASQCTNRGSGAGWPIQTGVANAFNLTIANGASLTVPTGKTLNIAGNLDNIGTLSATSGTIIFCGPSSNGGDQAISNNITFGNVTFNNQGGDILPNGSVTINGAATFTDGVVYLDVTFGSSATATANTYNSYVDGKVTKIGNGAFTFPTGGDGVLGLVTATLADNSDNVSVKFNHKRGDGDDQHGFSISEFPRWWNVADMCNSNTEPQLNHVSNFEYWKIDGLGTNTALSNLTLKVDADAQTEHFHNPSAYDDTKIKAVAHYNCWKNISDIAGNHASVVVTNDNNNHRTITVSGISTIPRSLPRAADGGNFDGIITLGSTDHSTVLPIELTALTATCYGRSSLVEWTTASERNNDYFSLERSDDAINFTEVARIAGAGNSIEPLSYSYTDYGVRGGDNYYRLVQVDYDGTRTASEIVVANCIDMPTEEPEVLAYPNPFSGDLTVELENFGNQPARIDVYDVLGRIVYTEDVDAPQNNYQTVLHLGDLPKATYMVRVGTEEFVINLKVVKNE